MKNLFEMLQAIFGKNIISKTIGTRTNVIKLPTNKSSPLKNEFDVFKSAENPAVFEKLKKVIDHQQSISVGFDGWMMMDDVG